jgi:hypothetical protein
MVESIMCCRFPFAHAVIYFNLPCSSRTNHGSTEKTEEPDLDTSNANLEGEGHENPEGNGNDESLQDPPNIDGFMDNLTHQPKSPIKIICEFQVFFPSMYRCES